VRNYCAAGAEPGGFFEGLDDGSGNPRRVAETQQDGKLHALRRISTLGRITYQVLGFEGDGRSSAT